MAKKNEVVKTDAAKEVKEVKEVKAAVAKEVKTEVKAETKAAETKEAAPVEAKAVKKPAAKAKKAVAEVKEEEVVNLFLQYAGKQFTSEEIVAKAKEAAAAEAGLKRVSSIKSIDIYCKPEEHAAYYVANGGKIVGRIEL